MSNELKGQIMHYMAGNFSCQDLVNLMTDFLEGSLSFSERLRFQIHLGFCRGCRAYLSQMKTTIRTLGQLPAEPIPDDIREELLKRFRTWKKE
ncbi:anti-sigma factor family protein [Candidatus Nitronereus thalassa]|uniref:Zf-HC2 domain-containing protein n=1 Tax=Candidatus Nitronereus thalassa TaxID=3020898 RepID=A0ABU3KCS0_9BACT|nr:zf-HC2 domain-containing protein [Candidatus Nitronereus thalassa]MDT7044241.1 zf-HC2 domain-containing protein [Candidatus Nitronereus thalassa]